MKKRLFEYAVLLHPRKKKESTLLLYRDSLLATDVGMATKIVTRLIDETYEDDFDRIEILIKDF